MTVIKESKDLHTQEQDLKQSKPPTDVEKDATSKTQLPSTMNKSLKPQTKQSVKDVLLHDIYLEGFIWE